MKHSKHARKRMQQRSIPPLIATWLDLYGDEIPAPHGGTIRYFGKEARMIIKSEVGTVFYSKIKSLLNAYKVICDETVVTAGWRYKKLKI